MYTNVLWNWYHQHARVFDWQHIGYLCYLWWTCFSTDSLHTYGCKLCSTSRRLVPLFVWSRLHTGALKKNEKKLARSFNFTFRYIDDVLSLNTSRLGDFIDRIYPIELEIKDTTDTDRSSSYLDLHLETDSEGWKWTFTTKEMISIFPLWTFHLYVVTLQQHLHMEYISLSWYDIPELVVNIRISLIEGCC